MVVTEADLRQQVKCPTFGAPIHLPAGATLTPSAADFIKQWGLVIDDSETNSSTVRDDSPDSPGEAPTLARPTGGEAQAWNKDSSFPIHMSGERPRCICCGAQPEHKESSLTQLNAHHFAPKTHPRIKLRGKIDSLHALTLLIQAKAARHEQLELAERLGTVAAYCRELISAEYNQRPAADFELPGWSIEELHRATHNPCKVLGIDHLTIDETDDELQHWLNMARTSTRELEICALETFASPHHPYGVSICHGLNRLSSVWYFLQLTLALEAR